MVENDEIAEKLRFWDQYSGGKMKKWKTMIQLSPSLTNFPVDVD